MKINFKRKAKTKDKQRNKLPLILAGIIAVIIIAIIIVVFIPGGGISAQRLVDSNFSSGAFATHSRTYITLMTDSETTDISIDNTRSLITDHMLIKSNNQASEMYVTKIDKWLGVYTKPDKGKKWKLQYRTSNTSEDDSRTEYIENDNEKNITDINISDISDVDFSQETPENGSEDVQNNYIISGKISYITALALLGNNKQVLALDKNYSAVYNTLTSVGADIKMDVLMMFDEKTEKLVYIELETINETLAGSINEYEKNHILSVKPRKVTIKIYNDSFEDKGVFVPAEVDLNSVKVSE